MSFTSPPFFVFFGLYFLAGLLLPRRGWLWLAAVASSFFYGWWDWRFLFLLYYVVTVSWFVGRGLARSEDQAVRRRYVLLSVISCLAVLATFKYFGFFVDSFINVSAALGLKLAPRVTQILLPVGISFYTFHALSYTIDLYRRKLKAPADYLSLVVYLAFFPQLVAGPIVRASRFLPQIQRGPVFSPRKIKTGLLIIAWGYFLKVCVADSIALVVDPIFAAPADFESGNLLFAIICYSFQIYTDFAGYSMIAIGLAKLQGFDFPANFLAPYFSRSFREFWRRWHISLSSFLRDYLYIPLGGNRHGPWREDRNILTTMLLGGLWHGASYNFVVWGALHGLYLIIERHARALLPRLSSRSLRTLKWPLAAGRIGLVYVMVLLTWVFFRLHNFSDALSLLAGIARHQHPGVISNKFEACKVAALIVATLAVDGIFINRRSCVRLLRTRYAYACSLALLGVLIELFGSFGGGAFIYFQF